MNEPDSLDKLLHEWKSPDPAEQMDERVLHAWRSAFQVPVQPRRARNFWTMRINVPAPAVLAAALAAAVLLFWLRRPDPPIVHEAAPQTRGIVTQLDARGFEPLPNGEARLVSAREIPDEK
jgi:hypothetical protein